MYYTILYYIILYYITLYYIIIIIINTFIDINFFEKNNINKSIYLNIYTIHILPNMDTADMDNVDTNTADTNTDAAVTTFTLEDVEKLNYIIIDNNVYDLTEFEEDHPGGAGVLRYFKGKNATEKFHSIPSHDNEHIKKKLLTFLKGTLEK